MLEMPSPMMTRFIFRFSNGELLKLFISPLPLMMTVPPSLTDAVMLSPSSTVSVGSEAAAVVVAADFVVADVVVADVVVAAVVSDVVTAAVDTGSSAAAATEGVGRTPERPWAEAPTEAAEVHITALSAPAITRFIILPLLA